MILADLFALSDEGKVGAFAGYPLIEWRGETDYVNRGSRFSFIRPNLEVITPGDFSTDGGSIPRFAWNLPGLNPWTYFPAYVVHDWLFTTKEKRPGVPVDFDEANLILAEMLVAMNCPCERVALIYEGVTLGGKAHWK